MPIGRVFRAYASDLLRNEGPKVALALTLMLSLAFIEGVGVLLLIPILQQIGLDVHQGSAGRLAGAVFTVLRVLRIPQNLPSVLVLYAIVMSSYALLQRWQDVTSYSTQTGFALRLRKDLYRAMAYADWALFTRSRASDVLHALTIETTRIATATQNLFALAVSLAVVLVSLILAYQLSPLVTGLVLLTSAGLWILLRSVGTPSRIAGQRLTVAMTELYAAASDHLAGMKVAKSYNAEDRSIRAFSELADDVADQLNRAVQSQATLKALFDIGSVITLSLLIYVATRLLNLNVSALLLLIFLFARAMPRFSGMQQNFERFINMLPAYQNLQAIQRRCEAAGEPVGSPDSIPFHHTLRLEGVRLPHSTRPGPPLDLTLVAGTVTALIGRSGAGKTTIADVIIGLIRPRTGRVIVDDLELTPERMGAWRNTIGYVEQDTFLFHATVRQNLSWAQPAASEDDMWSALRTAAADEVVQGLPKGLDTVLGDRAMRISGGERQRLALARALIRKPTLLILDEATNHLDAENEAQIWKAVARLRGQVTILLITHSLATVQGVDQVCVVEDGAIVDSGPWSELVDDRTGQLLRPGRPFARGEVPLILAVPRAHDS
jgi:ATP-binding cassette subfamily C protein